MTKDYCFDLINKGICDIEEYIRDRGDVLLLDKILQLKKQITDAAPQNNDDLYIIASIGRITKKIHINDILSISIDGRCCVIKTKDKHSYICNKKIKDIITFFGDEVVQLNRSCLMPKNNIIHLERSVDGGYKVIIEDDEFPVSRRCLSGVKRILLTTPL